MSSDEYDHLRDEFVTSVSEMRKEFVGAVRDLSQQLTVFTSRLEILTKEQAVLAERSRLTACPKPGLCIDLEAARKEHDEQIKINTAAINELRGAKKSLIFVVGLATAAAQAIQFAVWFFMTFKPGP